MEPSSQRESFDTRMSLVEQGSYKSEIGTADLQQIAEWNCLVPTGTNLLVHESIAAISRLQPERPAVCSWDGELSYQELDELSSTLAHHLVQLGAGPESLVGVCFNKSMWTVVAMLATLKAGAGFVPLNPDHPEERLQDIVDQIESRIILIAPQYETLCRNLTEAVVPVSRAAIAQLPVHYEIPKTAITPSNTAYVLFTSGSTGKPKGVVIEHRAASSSMHSHGRSMNFGKQSRVFQFATYTFDACIAEIFTTLVFGGCICVPSDEQRISCLAESMRNMRATWAFFTPTVARTLTYDEVPTLETLVLGGEALGEEDVKAWADKLCLINGYGPTETTVFCTMHEYVADISRGPEIIGKGIGGLCWLVDPLDLTKLTPVGERGELLMESPALMRGYLGDSKKTNEVLIEAPLWRDNFSLSQGYTRPKLYKTGDIARFDSDGRLIYLGRKDRQVKLRGQRLELGEVEHQIKRKLLSIPLAGVELVAPGSRQKMLAAFFLVKDGQKSHGSSPSLVCISESTESALRELRMALSQSLPEYEVPSLYIPLDELPLTVSGKLDRASLRTIAKRLSNSEIQTFSLNILNKDASSIQEPLTLTEEILRSLWSRALGIEEIMIGPYSSFFKLGADSVSAMRLSSLARKEQFALTVADILRSEGSLRLMATFLVAEKESVAESHRPAPFALLNDTITSSDAISEVSSTCTLLPTQILDMFPCTPLQEAMMALGLAQPGAYVAQYVFRLPTGSVDAFRGFWEVLHRHTETLRTRIAVLGKTAYQVVVDDLPTWATSSTVDDYLSHDRRIPMEYYQPLNRTGLVEQEGEHFFIWTAHHSIYDGYSFALLLREFDRLFKGLAPCVAPSMASLTRFLSNLDQKSVGEFWKAELEEATPSSFPSTFNGERRATQIVQHRINTPNTPNLGFSRHTTTTYLRAAWAIVAARYSNSNEDIVYGVTLNGRNTSVPGIDELQGPTIATIPFRVRFSSKAQTIISFLDEIQQKSITLFEHSGYEHMGLQNIKKLDSHTDHACDFQSLLVVQNQSREDLFANETGLQLVECRELGFDSYSLVLECFLEAGGIQIRAVYDPNVFPGAQAVSLMFQIHHVYDQLLTEAPERTISDIEVFSPHDRTTLRKWNEEEPGVVDRVIHEIIHQHTQQTPESVAVNSWDGTLTFRELEEVSDALALRLANLGVGSTQKFVPLCFEKSLWAVVSKIAVMKTGAAFVPLGSGLPLLRLQNICKQISHNDSMLPVMLVSPNNSALCSTLAKNVIALDSTSFADLGRLSTPFIPNSVVTPNHAAYVIFTSGSTGTPKGVVLQHQAACTSMMAHGKAIGFSKSTRTLQFCAYTFDVSVGEIMTTLCFGGCVCIPAETDGPEGIAPAINNMKVNLALLTPVLLKLFRPEDVPTLKTLVSGGESHSEDCIQLWSKQLKIAYGPTEAAIICMVNPINAVSNKTCSAQNIGRGVGCRLWVVDCMNHDILTPIGAVGELLIEGSNLAASYLNDPQKTSASFISNPRWAAAFGPVGRFYKTGDLVLQNPDGTLDFISRKDSQIKLNGQRIEIGEIERQISDTPSIEHVAVFLPVKGAYKKRITAVVSLHWPVSSTSTSDSGYESDNSASISADINVISGSRRVAGKLIIDALQARISNLLPPYMVPKGWIVLERFPLNRSTKLDRPLVKSWLEATTQNHDLLAGDEAGPKQPANDTQRLFQGAWSDVLGVSKAKVGMETSFIALGGDSISAIKLMWRYRKLGFEITVRDILRFQTIEKLSEVAQETSEVQVATEISSGDAELASTSLKEESQPVNQDIIDNIQASTGLRVADVYPCSPMQQGLLLSQIKNPTTYRVELVFEIVPTMHIDLEKVCNAWSEVVQRHAILRTIFVQNISEHSHFSQVIFEAFQPRITTTETDSEDTILKLPPSRYSDNIPPHHLTICSNLQNGKTFCKLEMSHAITDGSSLTPLINDFIAAYDGRLAKGPALQYCDYMQYVQKQSQANNLTYWKTYLEGVRPCELPCDLAGVEVKTEVRSVAVPAIDHDRFQIFCIENGLTKSTIFRAAWALCLSLYNEQDDEAVFGFLTSGRDIPMLGIDDVIGPLMNMVVCRTQIDHRANCLEFLETMQESLSQSLQHQTTPLGEIHRELGLTGDARLFNTILSYSRVLQNERAEDESIGVKFIADYDATEYDISVLIREESATLSAALRYRADHFSEDHAKNIAHTFGQIIFSIVDGKSVTMSELDFMSQRDKAQLKVWNSHLPPRTESCIHHLIAEHHITIPQAEAVTSWDGSFTFQELHELSDCLAYQLSGYDVRCGTYVPILMEKSKWVTVSMLAVLKAGAAFCPMDPSHPKSRLISIITDLGADLLLTSTQNSQLLTGAIRSTCIIDGDEVRLRQTAKPALWPPSVTHLDPAYVIYTSGSTGNPKGVVVEHGSYCSSAEGHRKKIQIDAKSRILQFASYSFDTSMEDHLTTLIVGGTICVPSEYERMNDIAGAINRMGANWIHITPSVANLIPPEEVPGLRIMALGGEAMTTTNIRNWSQRLKLINVYGPSEACVTCTVNDDPDILHPAKIGKSVSSISWIVSPTDHTRLMPIGAPGELVVEGPIVARGYLNDPTKTSASFIRDMPWMVNPTDSRAYKTGDMAKYSPDGSLTYLGRKDTQIKLHGQRIEIAEVEHRMLTSLQSCGENGQVAVELVRFRGGKESALVGFVAFPFPDGHFDGSDVLEDVTTKAKLRLDQLASPWIRRMSEHLPQFMIPTLIPLREIPITTSGKRDRRRLKEIASRLAPANFTSTADVKRAPSTTIEKVLQYLWAQVLNVLDVTEIGLDDNFFRSFGGDSMSAMKLVSVCRARGFALTVADIFRNPVFVKMVPHMQALQSQDQIQLPDCFSLLKCTDPKSVILECSQACGIEEAQITDIYPVTPLQEGLLAMTSSRSGSYINQDVFELPRDLDANRFRQACEFVFQDIPILRTRIYQSTIESCSLQVVLEDNLKWQSTRSLGKYLEEDRHEMSFGTQLVRFGLVEEPEKEAVYFVLTIHHSLYDGESLPMVYTLIDQKYSGLASELKYEPFNLFIRHLGSVQEDAQREFWMSYLQNSEQAITFPEPRLSSDQKTTSRSNSKLPIQLNRSMSEITTATVVQAAWALLMGQYSNSRFVLFGSTLSGRTAPIAGIERIIGPTISTVPLRFKIDPRQSVNDFLQLVQRASTDVTNFAHFGLQNIKQAAHSPCDFQNLLVVQMKTKDTSLKTLGTRVSSGSETFNTVPLIMQCAIEDGGLLATADFDTAYMHPREMNRMLHQFATILRQIAETENNGLGNVCLGDIHVDSPEDITDIIDWNSEDPKTIDSCVHRTIAQRAHESPEKVALCSTTQGDITYAELIELSQKIAITLLDLGVCPGMIIPVVFDKDVFAVVSMISIWMVGCAYVPVSPNHPAERQLGLFKQVQARLLLTSPHHSQNLRNIAPEVRFLAIDGDMVTHLPSITEQCRDKLTRIDVTPESNAYILFTSGSTGTPKGVVLTHKAVSTSTNGHGEAMRLTSGSRAFQFASYTFDASIAEIFTSLTRGATVCVPSEHERMNDLAGAMTRLRVNWSFLTPSVARLLQTSEVPTLRTLVLGGEAVGKADIDQWVGKVHLMNGYGPTETTVFAVTHEICSDTAFSTIGRAVSSKTWIVEPDNHHKLAPIGAPGELLISGASLASGYLNDVEKTQNSFITGPRWIQQIPGLGTSDRFYKTGDLVRYNAEGRIEFISRKDDQVKINGQRIELGEVEHWIGSHETTRQTIAMVPKTGLCKDQLVAVISLNGLPVHGTGIHLLPAKFNDIATTRISEIKQRLADNIPSYSIPTVWAVLDSIPLSVSTKVDRSSVSKWVNEISEDTYLRLLSFNIQGVGKKCTAPLELKLQQIWASVLSLPTDIIDAEQSFFQYGGDSISAIRVVQKCRSEGISLTVQNVLASRNLADLAKRAEDSITTERAPDPVSVVFKEAILDKASFQSYGIQDSDVEFALPCSHMQERILAIQTKLPGFYDTEMVFDIMGREEVNLERLTKAWNVVVNRHEMMRTILVRCEHDNGRYCQVVLKQVEAKILVLDTAPGNRSSLTVRSKVSDISDYRQFGVPHRLTVLRAPPGKLSMKIEISHAITDGASLMVLLRDLRLEYDGHMQNVPAAPSFSQHTAQLQGRQQQDFSYWENYCVGASPCYLPQIPSAEKLGTNDGLVVRYVNIDLKHAGMLSSFCQRQSISVSNLFCAIWSLILKRYASSNADDIIFGYLVSGREAAEETVGPLFSALISRIKLHEDTTVERLLETVRDDFAESSAHQVCDMQRIERGLGIDVPLFNTMVNFRKFPAPDVEEEPSLRFEVLEGVDPFDYDMMLLVKETKDSWKINLAYWSTKIDHALVQTIANNFDSILSSAIENVSQTTTNVLAISTPYRK